MILYIDNREPSNIINYIKALNKDNNYTIELKNLDIGDYIIYDEKKEKNIVIIERKSLADLEASIKDGRYDDQSFRLNDNNLFNHNIYYLIEGSIINYKKENFKQALYSSLISLSFFKGFSIINSLNNVESGDIIYRMLCKLIKEKAKTGYYEKYMEKGEKIEDISNNLTSYVREDYINVVKNSKKSYINNDNILEIMLMQIPGISIQTSKSICNKFKNMQDLIYSLENDNNCLDSIKLENSNRKINKNSIINIKKFLLRSED